MHFSDTHSPTRTTQAGHAINYISPVAAQIDSFPPPWRLLALDIPTVRQWSIHFSAENRTSHGRWDVLPKFNNIWRFFLTSKKETRCRLFSVRVEQTTSNSRRNFKYNFYLRHVGVGDPAAAGVDVDVGAAEVNVGVAAGVGVGVAAGVRSL